MKIIQDNITSISSSESTSSWPIANTRDDYPENYTEVDNNNSTITVQLGAPTLYANEVFIGYTNATSGTITGKDLLSATLFIDTLTINTFDYFNYVTDTSPFSQSQSWYSYTNPEEEHTLELDLTTTRVSKINVTAGGSGYSAGTFVLSLGGATNCTGRYNVNSSGAVTEFIIDSGGEGFTSSSGIVTGYTLTLSDAGTGLTTTVESKLQVGIIRGGFSQRTKNPAFGLSEGSKDLNKYLVKPDGTEFIVPSRILRTYSGTIYLQKDDSETIYRQLINARKTPVAMNLLDDDNYYVVFAKTSSLPSSKRDSYTQKQVSFTVQEM